MLVVGDELGGVAVDEGVDLAAQGFAVLGQVLGRLEDLGRRLAWVAAPCSSIAAAMAEAISLISEIVLEMPLIASTVPVVADCMLPIWALISSVALAVWLARLLTSEATTAKP